MKKNLVIGIGNLVLSDDAVGPLIVRRAEEVLADAKECVDFKENYSGGLDMLDDINGYDRLLIVDCVKTGSCEPGTCITYGLNDFEKHRHERSFNSHILTLPTVLDIGKRCGYKMPDDIIIWGIEADDTTTFSEEPTDKVKACIDGVVEKMRQTIAEWQKQDALKSQNAKLKTQSL